ncbi:MAG TPA: hypothetical protein VHF89_00245 [Solirubrobacteraceae bacterium]|nr:hypothetical protein [Solirubrobacteraceae bacterium]
MDLPIACTLTPSAMTDRLEVIARLRDDALLGREATAEGMRVRLRDEPGVERRARELIAAEAQCCAFLSMSLGRVDGELVLEIAGPPEARPVIETFFAPA